MNSESQQLQRAIVPPAVFRIHRKRESQSVKVGEDVVKNPEKASGVFVGGCSQSEASEFQDVEPSLIPLDNV